MKIRKKCINSSLNSFANLGDTNKLHMVRTISNVIKKTPTALTGPTLVHTRETDDNSEPSQHVATDSDPGEDPLGVFLKYYKNFISD